MLLHQRNRSHLDRSSRQSGDRGKGKLLFFVDDYLPDCRRHMSDEIHCVSATARLRCLTCDVRPVVGSSKSIAPEPRCHS